MNALTAKELAQLNYVAGNSKLGTKLQAIIAAVNAGLFSTGTPVNAVAATQTLTIAGVVVDGETVTIVHPNLPGWNVYEFLGDAAQTKTTATNTAVNIAASMTKSSGTLTMDTQPTSGDTMTIGAKEYIFVPNGTNNAEGEVSIGTSLATAKTALVAAINGTDGVNTPHPLVSAAAFAVNDCVITALVGGVIGDAIATTETFTAGTNVFAAATLGGGVDCSAANAVTALVAAITASDTQGVGAVDGAGDTVVLTADVAGVVGNTIVVEETMANGSLAGGVTHLTGGVNGTVGAANQIMVDASYLYVCSAINTVSGANWRRISLGAAY